jgi:hypothetical protein
MAEIPFHEGAEARYGEAHDARERLLASLEELRRRADTFLAVAESTATVFAVLARPTSAPGLSVDSHRRPPDYPDSPAVTGSAAGGPSHHRVSPPAKGHGTWPYPDDTRRGVIEVRTSR